MLSFECLNFMILSPSYAAFTWDPGRVSSRDKIYLLLRFHPGMKSMSKTTSVFLIWSALINNHGDFETKEVHLVSELKCHAKFSCCYKIKQSNLLLQLYLQHRQQAAFLHSLAIVNVCRWLWSSTSFFVSRFCSLFWPWPCTKTHFFRQDNQSNVSTNLFASYLRTKNKRLCRVTVDSISIATALFLLFEISKVS